MSRKYKRVMRRWWKKHWIQSKVCKDFCVCFIDNRQGSITKWWNSLISDSIWVGHICWCLLCSLWCHFADARFAARKNECAFIGSGAVPEILCPSSPIKETFQKKNLWFVVRTHFWSLSVPVLLLGFFCFFEASRDADTLQMGREDRE
jgi:hypothetical protein